MATLTQTPLPTGAAGAPTDRQRDKAAMAFIAKSPKLHLIGGKWIPSRSGKTFETINPATEQVVATVARADASDVDAAVKAARKAFTAPSWSEITPYERANYLLKIADLIAEHTDELATIQTIDMGMPLSQSKAMTATMVDVFRYFAGWTTKIFGQTYPSNSSSMTYTIREPLGIVGAIIPWNGPISAATWKIAPGLACGNTVVFKSAEQAPLVPLRLAELLQEAGLPDGVINVVSGFGEDAGDALVRHPDVNKINFTGSTAVGQGILRSAADNLKKVTLELGGKSPTIIFDDADLSLAIPAALGGFCNGAGQACIAGSRVFVHEKVYKEVLEGLVKGAKAVKVGDPFDPSTKMGPLVTKEQFDRVTGYIKAGQEEGAVLQTGGKRIGTAGYFVEPTVFDGVSDRMKIVQEEIFGPVGAIIPFKNIDEMLMRANDTPYGLSCAVFTNNIKNAHTVARVIQSGYVWVNTIHETDAMAPFGGYRLSGVGRELGQESIEANTQTKTVMFRF